MTKPGTEAEKAKSEAEAPLPIGSLSPKPNIMYIEVNLYATAPRYAHSKLHTVNAFSSSSRLTKNALKPPHSWIVSIDGQHSKVLQKPKAMRYAFLPKRTGRQEHLDNCPTHVTRLPSQGCRNRSPRVHRSQCELPKPPHLLHLRTQKAASRTAKKANAQGG